MVAGTPTTWSRALDLPNRLFENNGGFMPSDDGYELYEEDGQFILTIDMPGFDADEISLRWNDGRLAVSAEHVDEDRNRQKNAHRTFRLPKDIVVDDITATYSNGVLEVTLPIEGELTAGTEIPIES
jgi:HSP20 family protein